MATRLDGRQAFDQWHEVCRPFFEVEPRGALPSFKSGFEFYEVSGLVFSHTRCSAANFHRTARHVRGDGKDCFALQLLLRGRERGEAAGRPLLVAPDRIVLRDWSRPFDSTADETEQLGVIIPRGRIVTRDRLRDRVPAASWDLQSPPGMMLANALISLWRILPQATGEDAPALATGFLGLLNGLLCPNPEPAGKPALNRAGLAAMKAFLDQRLRDADLGVDDLVDAFHLSRPVIYRMFREAGGVRAFIQERRLGESFRELTSPGKTPRPLWEVARRWGFRDPAYFHRAFKSRFGITAGEVAKACRTRKNAASAAVAPPLPKAKIAALHRWLEIMESEYQS